MLGTIQSLYSNISPVYIYILLLLKKVIRNDNYVIINLINLIKFDFDLLKKLDVINVIWSK